MSSAFLRSRRLTVKRKALMISCASLAMATAVLAPQKATAQAFNGTLTPSAAGTRTITGTGTETINVNTGAAGTATLNWTPDDGSTSGNIVFLPFGNTATFVNTSPSVTDYTVLNRVVPTDPTRAIELNGSILSRLNDGTTVGGNIWFYSPGGIVVGANAYFDVGSLLLSTIDVTNGWTADANGFSASFAKTQTNAGAIQILDGAQIDALNQNSYVALVAPRIEQGGNVQVNGSAAYVAAEALTMTMDQGLFDIAVDLGGGTDDVNGIVHTGTTGGPASTGAGDNHVIYMAAVPKNQALSMLLSGNVGYAASATVENGQIVLTAGWTPTFTGGGDIYYQTPDSSLDAGLQILGGNFTSDVTAFGNSDMFVGTYDSSLNFDGELNVTSDNGAAELNATNGRTLTVDDTVYLTSWGATTGSVQISATGGGSVDIVGGANLQAIAAANGGGQGGTASVIADGGTIDVGFTINANVSVWDSGPGLDGNSADTQGGSILIQAMNGGGITAGSIYADASATGANTTGGGDGVAGNGTGGIIEVIAESGGSIDVGGTLTAYADGSGGAVIGAGTAAGYGQGGEVVLLGDGGDIAVGDNTYLSTNGTGGSVATASVAGGAGYGGWAHVETWSSDASILLGGDVFINAAGIGGTGLGGGSGIGGSAGMQSFAGSIAVDGSAHLNAPGSGGDASVGFGGTGGWGEGGTAYIQAEGTSSLTVVGSANLDVGASGGDGGDGNGDNIGAGAGGGAQGGLYTGAIGSGGAFALADALGATLQTGNLNMYAAGYGGTGGTGGTGQAGGAGGDAYGGFAQAGGYDPSATNPTLGTSTFGDVSMDASAVGGDGGLGDNGNGGAAQGDGGDAVAGGNVPCNEVDVCGGVLLRAKGTVTAGTATLNANATGGSGTNGGDALGGQSLLLSFTGGTMTVASADIYAFANGGDGVLAGGAANGGYAGLAAFAGATLDVGGTVNLSGRAEGGNGSVTGGNATGGIVELYADAGIVTTGYLSANAAGVGGDGGAGGTGIGGTGYVTVDGGGSITTGAMDLNVRGQGGAGGSSATGGAGGDGFGGDAYFDIVDGSLTTGTVFVNVRGSGGDGGTGLDGIGGDGGEGTGGYHEMLVGAAGSVDFAAYLSSQNGIGGAGGTGIDGSGNGGAAQGGDSWVVIDGSLATSGGNYVATSFALGGNGANGGSAAGGTSEITVNGSASVFGTLQASGQAEGGVGSAGTGGIADAGSASITIDGDVTANAIFVGANALLGGAGTVFGGDAYGGSATLQINSGTVQANSIWVEAAGIAGNGVAGSGGSGGDAVGGSALIDIGSAATVIAGVVEASVNATGGTGASSTSGAGGAGGHATAGETAFINISGDVIANSIESMAEAIGGAGGAGATFGQGGSAYGGHASIDVFTGGSLISSNYVGIHSDAIGGSGSNGGYALGGTSGFGIYGTGTASMAAVSMDASGTGGSGTGGGDGATGDAGTAIMIIQGSATTSGLLSLAAVGTGGDGVNGGTGYGGEASLLIQGGSLTSTGMTDIVADGFGGQGTTGTGGDGLAWFARIENTGTWISSGEVFVSADGEGGDGASGGGDGYGSDAAVRLAGGTANLSGGVTVRAAGTGGTSTAGTGGDGIGGYARLSAYGGNVSTINWLTVDSSAYGGDGVDGGDGYAQPTVEGWGGSVVQTADSGSSLTVTGQTNVISNGVGGAGTGAEGIGGDGSGGYASLGAHTGSTLTTGNALLQVNGTGGLGIGGDGLGSGGRARLIANNADFTGGSITVQANGSTDGGEAWIFSLNGGDLNLQSLAALTNGALTGGNILVSVDAFSTADLGVASLAAIGAGADITIDVGGVSSSASFTGDAGDILLADNLTITSTGTINLLSENSASMLVDSNMSATAGGLITLEDNGGNAFIAANSIVLDGSSVLFNWDFDAFSASLIVDGNYTLAGLPTAVDYFSVEAGGSISAGALVTTASELELIAGTDLLLGNITGTGDIDLEAGGNITFGDIDTASIDFDSGGTVTGGNIIADVRVSGDAAGAVSLQDITVGPGPEPEDDFSVGITSLVSISVGDVDSYGRVGFATPGSLTTGTIDAGPMVMALVSGNISTGAITTDSTGTVFMADSSMFLDAGGGDDDFDPSLVLAATPVPTAGSIAINGTVNTGEFEAYAGTTLTTLDLVAASAITAQSGGNLQVGNASAGTSISLGSGGNIVATSLDAPTVSLAVAGDFTTGDLFVDDTLLVSAGGNLTAANIVAGGSLGLTAGLNLQTQNLTAGGSLTLNAGGSILTGNLAAGDGIAAGAGTTLTVGTVTTGYVAPPPPTALVSAAVVATGDDVTLVSGGNMTTGAINSTGAITLTSGGTMTTGALGAATNIGATSVGDMVLASASAGQNLALTTNANLTTGNLSGQTVTTSAGGTLSVANVNAMVSAMFTAGGLANFYGIVSAPTITVTSGDINIADGGALGVFGTTNLLTLNAVTGGGVVIGGEEGSSTSGSYTLAEAGDIRSAAVVVNAGGSAVTVRDVQIEGSQTSGGGVSSVTLNTGGSVIVEGAIQYTSAGAADTLAINAGEAIQVLTDAGGSIAMTDSSGNLAGTLALTADNVWVAEAAIIDQLESNLDFAGRDEALATNSGTADPDGSVSAGAIDANVSDSLLVQNSNTAQQPAGISVGDGGMTVNNTGSDPATVVIYGRQTSSDGTVTEGPAFVEDVDFEGSGGYSGDSTVNGCAVGSGCVPEESIPGGSESILGPIGMASSDPGAPSDDGGSGGDDESEDDEESSEDGDTSVDPSVHLINSGPLQLDTTVDEPITSGSDGPGGSI